MTVIHREELFLHRTKMKSFEREIATLLWEIRINSDIDESVFARKLGISTHQLIRYEGGLDAIPPALMNRICEVLGVSISKFFTILEDNIEESSIHFENN